MSIKDVIKNSVYESFTNGSGLTLGSILLTLLLACLIGIYIFTIYKTTSKAASYSRDLNITLAGMAVIVSAILIAMQSNLIVSLGMVGALSIVRFRNAVKNPIDLLYLFWSISAGIICGVGLHMLSILLCIIMTFLLLGLEMIPNSKASSLLVIRSSSNDVNWENIKQIIRKHSKYCKEKSHSIKNGESEIIIELKTSEEEVIIKELSQIKFLQQINFLSHDGEYRI